MALGAGLDIDFVAPTDTQSSKRERALRGGAGADLLLILRGPGDNLGLVSAG